MKKREIGYSANVHARVRSKYRKCSHHKKKVKSEIDLNKEAWRQEKQIGRDKANRLGTIKNCFSDGVPPWLKRQCNKAHRKWEKHCITNGDFDRLPSFGKRKDFFDPWMWF